MSELPSPETLASLVSATMDTMFGLTFRFADRVDVALPLGADPGWRTFGVLIEAAPPLLVAISSDDAGGRALASAMFGCSPEDADAEMVGDALGELTNILAGQLKSSMGLTCKLLTPGALESGIQGDPSSRWRAAFVRSAAGDISVWTAITEVTSPA